ncbi:DUF3619 family protein [Pseudomaricurvus alcaniphilus]|uniref:DUF3619 family protein n=1 Tax=Pseudomaricurvus alcaniphilus TaxID=1166482 RepID=UPI0014088114|nr:DUF3619 family protein [Pseudomaricurvus alcaniphilus]NHN39110.1 DUF3619 family protein [Pseudomaricurvus alcaniphilus]
MANRKDQSPHHPGQEQEQALATAIRQQLDQQVDSLDASTVSRLRQARARAMEHAAGRLRRPAMPLWGAGLASASVFALAMLLWLSPPASLDDDALDYSSLDEGSLDNMEPLFTDTDILLDDESVEFYGELDFYLWLQREGLQREGLQLEGLPPNGLEPEELEPDRRQRQGPDSSEA